VDRKFLLDFCFSLWPFHYWHFLFIPYCSQNFHKLPTFRSDDFCSLNISKIQQSVPLNVTPQYKYQFLQSVPNYQNYPELAKHGGLCLWYVLKHACSAVIFSVYIYWLNVTMWNVLKWLWNYWDKLGHFRAPHPTRQLWSQLTVCTTWCISANQNTTLVLIIVLPAERTSIGYLLTLTPARQFSSTQHVFCPDVVSKRRGSVKTDEAVIR